MKGVSRGKAHKLPRQGESEGTFVVFESSCHLLLPV